jgi:phospholipid-binding lipoprotein MlaA
MRLRDILFPTLCALALTDCTRGPNPDDPYESTNRKVYDFNKAFDATVVKQPAKLYRYVTPAPIRKGVNNVFAHVNLIPTIANDILQVEVKHTIRDSWRFVINSTFGVAGIFDIATQWSLPLHQNDFGITLYRLGYQKSAYWMMPLLGPSTIRDGVGYFVDYAATPYPYLRDPYLINGLGALRTLDIRTQFFETEQVMNEALDGYTFMRDAYLQNRHYAITGEKAAADDNLYVAEDALDD